MSDIKWPDLAEVFKRRLEEGYKETNKLADAFKLTTTPNPDSYFRQLFPSLRVPPHSDGPFIANPSTAARFLDYPVYVADEWPYGAFENSFGSYRMEIMTSRFVPDDKVLVITDEARHSLVERVQEDITEALEGTYFWSRDTLRCVDYGIPVSSEIYTRICAETRTTQKSPAQYRQPASWHRLSRREKRRMRKARGKR